MKRAGVLLGALALLAGGTWLGRAAVLRLAPTPTLEVRSTPSAAIHLDGVYRGVTPQRFTDLAPGPHAVRLSREGYRTHREAVDPARTPRLDATLEAVPVCTLTVRSVPAGAAIYLDGERRGRTPRTFDDLAPGRRHVELVKTNYLPAEERVALAPGAPAEVELALDHRQEQAYRAALEADPYDLAAYNDLGELLIVLGRPREAAKLYVEGFIRAGARDKLGERARQNLHRLVHEPRKKHREEAFRTALDEAVLLALARGEAGEFVLQDFQRVRHQGRETAYRTAMDRCIAHHPEDPEIRLALAPHYRKLNAVDRIVEILGEAAAFRPADAGLQLAVLEEGNDLLQHHAPARKHEALAALLRDRLARTETLERDAAASAALRFERGRFAWAQGRKTAAEAAVRAAIEATPGEEVEAAFDRRLWLADRLRPRKKWDEIAALIRPVLQAGPRRRHQYHRARRLLRALPKDIRKKALSRDRD